MSSHRTKVGLTLIRGRIQPLQPLCLLLLPAGTTSNHKTTAEAQTAKPAKGHLRMMRAQPPTKALRGGRGPVTTNARPHDHLGRATCATNYPRTSPATSSSRRNPSAGPVPRASAGARSANGTYHWLTSPRTNVAYRMYTATSAAQTKHMTLTRPYPTHDAYSSPVPTVRTGVYDRIIDRPRTHPNQP